MGFTITTEYDRDFTRIPNWFIRTYMASANGNFVKLYLYLAMVSQQTEPADDLSVSILADYLECTENDVLRALRYWQKEDLLSYQEVGGEIQSILLTTGKIINHTNEKLETVHKMTVSLAEQKAKQTQPLSSLRSVSGEREERDLPARQEYTPLQAEALIKDVEIDQTITMVEQLLGTTISATHLQMILYFMCDVGFSKELILTMYKTALDKGKDSPKYIEAIGINWAKKGITSPDEAGVEAESFHGIYHTVARSLGIQRTLAPAEREIIDEWRAYGFTDDIIQEACQRTVVQTGGTNLNYVARILKEWHRCGVTTTADIEKCDASFQQRKKNHAEKKTTAAKNQFQNFPQRSYSKDDYSSLEKQLLREQA